MMNQMEGEHPAPIYQQTRRSGRSRGGWQKDVSVSALVLCSYQKREMWRPTRVCGAQRSLTSNNQRDPVLGSQ